MRPLIIRVDAGGSMGLGHLMRCLALSRAWPSPAMLVMAAPHPQATAGGLPLEIVAAAPGSVDDARATAALARLRGAEWVVVDGYHFDADYHRVLRGAGLHTLCIDDNGEAGDYVADVIVNQNPHASADIYARRAEHTALLLGTDYVMLRPEFIGGRITPPAPPIADRLLVTLGGGTSEKALITILEGLVAAAVPWREVTVITGGVPTDALAAAAARVPADVRLFDRAERMFDLMTSASLAISAGGSTTWELACMGVPAILVVAAANQRAAAAASEARGIAVVLGDIGTLQADAVAACVAGLARDAARRARMTAAGIALIDGRGADRVVAAMAARTAARTAAPAGGA